MNIVITGGTGFIGQAVADIYLKAGHAVFVTGHEAPVPGAEYQGRDFQAVDWKQLPALDILNHQAAVTDPQHPDPDETFKVNFRQALDLFRAAAGHGVRRIVYASSAAPIYLWDATAGKEVRHFQTRGHYIGSLAYSSDGRMLASGGSDKTVSLWEAATGKERWCFKGHQGNVNSIAFSADGTRLVSASADTTALVWDATAPTLTGKPTDKQLQDAWSDLAGDDAAKAYRALWLLARHPKQSVPLLREHVSPARAVDAEMRKQIEQWLADLDSGEAAVRECASAELEKRVLMVELLLRKALTGKPSLEQRKRIERVLERLEREQVMLGRALEALQRANVPEARQLLETLAKGDPRAWLTQEAKAVLVRLAS